MSRNPKRATGLQPARQEARFLQKKWAAFFAHVPLFNPHLSRLNESFTLVLPG
jgi:hypothetical protein